MRLLVIGHARHGKDSLCDLLQQGYGLRFISSSHFAAERAVRPWLEQRNITYPSLQACYADRARLHSSWFQAIAEYNTPDPTRLCREMMTAGYDIYCGLRSRREFEACMDAEVFDGVVWVDASQRAPLESSASMELRREDADWVVDNNRDLHELKREADLLMAKLQGLLG